MAHGFSRHPARRTCFRAPPGPLGHMTALVLMGWLAGCGGGGEDPAAPDANQVTCPSGWGTGAFFRTATPAQVAACVEAGESVRARSADGDTPLHIAGSFSDDPEVIRALINAGARAGARNNFDHTVLCVAVVHNENEAVIQALLDGGSTTSELCRAPNDPDGIFSGITPLHLAAGNNANPLVAEVLLQAGADVNAQGGIGGRTLPIWFAAFRNDNPAVIELLLRWGSELWGAVHGASYNENPEIMRVLVTAGADLSGALHTAVFNSNVEIAEVLIEAGADLNEIHTEEGMPGRQGTPLHWAARNAGRTNIAVAELLLESGADPNARDADEKTPLDRAEEAGYTAMADLLRRYGGQGGLSG